MTSAVESKSTSLAELNRVFWDANADTFFEKDWLKVFAEQLTSFLRSQAPNLGIRSRDAANPVRLLDYACAYGGASWALAPFVDEILGIDIAPAIVDRFNDCAARLGYDPSQARAIAGDLATDESLAAPALFDVVIISMALHHLDDSRAMLLRLAERVKPGGVLIAVEGVDADRQLEVTPRQDIREAPGVHHGHDHGHHHAHHAARSGAHKSFEQEVLNTTNHQVFDEDLFREWFRDAGCDEGGFVYLVNEEVSHIPEEYSRRPGGLNRNLVIAASVKR
ncbi:methyltransferase domain-containing protein [Colletotrichum sojae]|uniref:Methyltransferase domain-containing protein n=1 Tax=Colletotrichum sojae TaxID=2175907 RepID=A0A8H6JGK6_9PEZI|nr:methyltransferase domain-containing protein [Colletotrichum sojae]